MRQFTTTVRTKKGNFNAKINVSEIGELDAVVIVENVDYPALIKTQHKDRMYAGDALCKLFGVENNGNVALSCDPSKAIYHSINIRKGSVKKQSNKMSYDEAFNARGFDFAEEGRY